MAKPKLLTLDEPSMGLAPIVVKTIFQIIREVNGEGVTVLLVEQNARMALRLANRAYVLETGRIATSGTAQELMSDDLLRASYLGA
jgi:branched-chain amino acid transport system ATP-binding protein